MPIRCSCLDPTRPLLDCDRADHRASAELRMAEAWLPPAPFEEQILERVTDLTIDQMTNWVINRRILFTDDLGEAIAMAAQVGAIRALRQLRAEGALSYPLQDPSARS